MDKWDVNTIRKFRFSLSDKNPVTGRVGEYLSDKEYQFDMHYDLELGIVLEGKMQRQYKDYKVNLSPGDVWISGIWEPHGFRILKSPCKVVVLVLLPQTVAGMRFQEDEKFNIMAPFIAPPAKRPKVSTENKKEIIRIGKKVRELLGKKAQHRNMWFKQLFIEVLLNLDGKWKGRAGTANTGDSASLINKAVQMTFESKKLLTEQDVAKELSMNRNKFNEHFTEMMGMSFSKFALGFRLSGAAAELLHSSKPLKAIAVDWGFTDVSHFHKWFSKYYKCSPVKYRR